MSSHQLEIPSAAALLVVAGLVVATVWTVPHQVVGQENIETKSHIDGKLVEPGNSVNGEVEDIRGTDHYKIDIEQPGKLTVNVSKSEGNESKLFASVHRMETHRLINYTTLERGGQLTAEITNPGMHYVEIEGDGYTNYSFTVNFDPSETNESTTDTPTETTDTPTETTDTPTETTDTPTETTDTPTETTDTPTETTDTPTETTDTPTETTDTPTETTDTPTETTDTPTETTDTPTETTDTPTETTDTPTETTDTPTETTDTPIDTVEEETSSNSNNSNDSNDDNRTEENC